MEDREVEEKLKESADKANAVFDSKRDAIKQRLLECDTAEDATVCEAVLVTATETGEQPKMSPLKKRRILLVSLLAVCILTLGLVLPFVLKTDNRPTYFSASSLLVYVSYEEEFYKRLDESEIELIDISDYDAFSYNILVTEDNIVKGGEVEFIDEEEGNLVQMVFYDLYVTDIEEAKEDYVEYSNHRVSVKYKTILEDDVYSTVAVTQYNQLNYYIELISLDDNVTSVWDKLFGI